MPTDFLCLTDWTRDELEAIFELTRDLKAKLKRGEPHRLLEGKTLAMIFEKSSTRTRVSFEVGMHQLGGHALFLASGTTHVVDYDSGGFSPPAPPRSGAANRSRTPPAACPATATGS